MAFLRVKCDLEGDIRRFCLDEPLVFVELKKHLETIYDMGELVIKYKDDEGDLVTIAAEADLLEARNLFDKEALFRFKLFTKETSKKEKKEKLCEISTSTPKNENELQLQQLMRLMLPENKPQLKQLLSQLKKDVKQVSKEALKPWKGQTEKHASGNPVKAMARFVSHVTMLDGEKIPAGARLTKIWRVRNDSPRPWPCGPIELVYVSGKACDRLSAEDAYPVEIHSLAPGAETDLSVEITAPTKPGLYQAFWRLRGPKGNKFGQRLSCSVLVMDHDDVLVKDAVISESDVDTSDDDLFSFSENEDSDGFVDVPSTSPFDKSEPRKKWLEELAVLKQAGFDDAKLSVKMLKKCKGDVAKACKKLAKKNLKKATKAAKKLEEMTIKQAKSIPGPNTDVVAPAQVETTSEAEPSVGDGGSVTEPFLDPSLKA